jgi:transposase
MGLDLCSTAQPVHASQARLQAALEGAEGVTGRRIAARYGASRQSVYGWAARYEPDGIDWLDGPWHLGPSARRRPIPAPEPL